ncbi:MAG: PHP domain-containing protein [Thermofilaceae archaeon]
MIPRLDLHVHSQFSPCANDVSIERDVDTALAKGVRVIAITDHGTVPSPPWFENYLREVERAQKKVEGKLTLLRGMEVDIVEGGRLAVSVSLLKQLDVVVASLHSIPEGTDAVGYWRRSIIRAIESGFATVIGHPTDVGWRKLKPDLEDALEVLDVARSHRVAVELNYHHRDPEPWFLRLAIERSVPLVPTSDAHSLHEIGNFWWHEERIRSAGYDPSHVKWLDEGSLANAQVRV